MENNFELEELKQQWTTLQNTINNKVHINVELTEKSAKSHYSWLKKTFAMSFIGTPIGILSCWLLNQSIGIPLPICIFLSIIILIQGFVSVYLYFNIPNPLDSTKSILSINRSIVQFRRVFISSTLFGCTMLIFAIVWVILTVDLNANSRLLSTLMGAICGFAGAMIYNKKALNHLKELREDFHLMNEWKEQ